MFMFCGGFVCVWGGFKFLYVWILSISFIIIIIIIIIIIVVVVVIIIIIITFFLRGEGLLGWTTAVINIQ